MMRDLNRQWRQWTIDEPAVFITFNGMAYDEELFEDSFIGIYLSLILPIPMEMEG